jgi:hypothetical protein
MFLHHLCVPPASSPIPQTALIYARSRSIKKTYLVLNDALFKPRSAHSHLPRLLTPAPDALVVGRLQSPHALCICDILLQHLVERALGRCGRDVRLGDVGLRGALDGVVDGDFVDRGDVADRCAEGAGRAESADEHFGGVRVQTDRQLLLESGEWWYREVELGAGVPRAG